jgi:hypothetical protein
MLQGGFLSHRTLNKPDPAEGFAQNTRLGFDLTKVSYKMFSKALEKPCHATKG